MCDVNIIIVTHVGACGTLVCILKLKRLVIRNCSYITLLLKVLKIGVVIKSIQIVSQHLVAKCKLFLN